MVVAVQVVNLVLLNIDLWNLAFPYLLSSELVFFEYVCHAVYPFDKLVIYCKAFDEAIKFL